MARWFEPRPDQETLWNDWVAARPEGIRPVAARLRPWELYRLSTTGQIVTLASISEPEGGDGPTVRVNVLGHAEHDLLMPVFGVFGIDPGDLEPYEPSSKDELMALARRAAD